MNPDPSREDTLPAAVGLDATIRMNVRATLPVGMEQPGDMIGRYKLIEPLGEGGFGSVWRAEQSEPIRREVALKVIKAGMDSREIIARFEAERQALALMDHPNIAGVLDAGTTDSGRPYFAMELVKGVSITEYCDAQQLTIRQRLELFIPVCQAVQHAHQKAILHRDLKPSNILVAEVDGKPVPKVIDFGIAKALGTSPEALLQGSLLQTQAGAVIGTPQYMSPEQAGAAPDLDTRSDIYTLGIILYELLTGDTPLSRDSLRKAALDEVLRLVREADPKRPSSRVLPVTDLAKHASTSRQTEPAKLARTLSGDLDWIALKALEKERDRRYGSAAAFAQDLERYLKNEPVEAGPPSPVYRLRKLVQRNRLAFATAAAIVVLLAAGIGMTTWQWQQAEHEKARQADLLWTASRADHEAATRAFGEHQNAEGLAYLNRALEYRPMNNAALVTSANHAFGISAPAWRTRIVMAVQFLPFDMAFSPDGRYLATGSGGQFYQVSGAAKGTVADEGEIVRLIDLATSREISKTEFARDVHALSFIPDGRLLAAKVSDKSVIVIEAASGKEISKAVFEESVSSARFSPNGHLLMARVGDKSVVIIDAATGKEISKAVFGESVSSLSFSSDEFLLARVADNFVIVIEAATGKEVSKTKFASDIDVLALSPDGHLLALENSKRVSVVEVTTSREISKTEIGSHVWSATFSPDGRYLAVESALTGLQVIEVETGRLVSKMAVDEEIYNVEFSPDGRYLTAGSYKSVRVFEATASSEISKEGFHDKVRSMSLSPDGRSLAVGADDKMRIIEVATGKVSSRSEGVSRSIERDQACFSPDGILLASTAYQNKIILIEAATGKEIRSIEFGRQVNAVNYSADGRYLAVGTGGLTEDTGELAIIEASTGKEITKITCAGGVNSVSYSSDGRYVAAGIDGFGDGATRVIEIATGKEVSKFAGSVESISFSPDGHLVAVGNYDRTVRFIEAATGKEISKREVGRPVNAASFSSDGRYLAVGIGGYQEKGEARVLEMATGKEISQQQFSESVTSVSFGSGSRFLAVGSEDGTVRVVDGSWFNLSEEASMPWRSALSFQTGVRFRPDGRLETLSTDEMLAAQREVNAFVQAEPKPNEAVQHAILKWSQMPPEKRTTSPWITEPIRVAVGRWLIHSRLNRFYEPCPSLIKSCADLAPWHPLVPVILATLEPKPDDKTDPAVRETMWNRRLFLSRLTLKRLREADEKLYGRETLAKYAMWAYGVMGEVLEGKSGESERIEAMTIAYELTPKEDKQQELFEWMQKMRDLRRE
jgi:WD40 repeat protein/serine/threonine protein kinase